MASIFLHPFISSYDFPNLPLTLNAAIEKSIEHFEACVYFSLPVHVFMSFDLLCVLCKGEWEGARKEEVAGGH